jgi:carboxypeptidase C (cathepsin A)
MLSVKWVELSKSTSALVLLGCIECHERRIFMRSRRLFMTIGLAPFLLFAICGSTVAMDPADLPGKLNDTTNVNSVSAPKAEQSVTTHKLTIGGESIPYTATAGTLIVRDEKDLPYARMGYIAYIRSDISDLSHRPITFAYNGGPGSCSVWLHMGALGPKRIVTCDTCFIPPPPYRVVENEFSILDKTDIVMIDAIGTGFSHAVGEAENKDFWSVDPDIESFARFIRQYITDNGRWNSPKYLLGESYGTTRSAGVVDYLQCRESMSFNGVIHVSMATDLELLLDDIPGYHWPSVFSLPTYTAISWYHKMLPDPPSDITKLLQEVRGFALREYSNALAQGNDLPVSDRKAILEKLHRYTGLSIDYLDKANLRVPVAQFANELMREHGETVGMLDGRFLGVNFDRLGKTAEYDPMDAATTSAFVASFLDYLHRDLKFSPDRTYIFDASAFAVWDYRHKTANAELPQPIVNTGIDLAHAMGFNPNLRVLVLQGTYDLGSVALATEYMISHLDLQDDLRSHIRLEYYEAGHEMYTHEPSLKKFKKDVAAFFDQTKRP